MAKVYRTRRYLGDMLITEMLYDEDDESAMAWLEQFKQDVRDNHHPYSRLEVTTFVVEGTEVIVPDNPSTLKELGIE